MTRKHLLTGMKIQDISKQTSNLEKCSVCNGNGYIGRLICANCNGEGFYLEIK